MATLSLKIVVLPTYDVTTMNVADASKYPTDPPQVTDPFLLVTPPGFPPITLPFKVGGNNFLDTSNLGITDDGSILELPDGIYHMSYSIFPSYQNHSDISIMRVDKLQEKFDEVFMGLDMMECDGAIKNQAKVELNTIYLLIEGAKAAANACAYIEAQELYNKASSMLDKMMHKNCGCTGNNYFVNFY